MFVVVIVVVVVVIIISTIIIIIIIEGSRALPIERGCGRRACA